MAGRKKKPEPAALRTIDMFSGKTMLEEKKSLDYEEEERDERSDEPRNIVEESEDCAIRWLGLDAFHEHGDDVKIAVHPSGYAVMCLVRTTPQLGIPYATMTVKFSRAQWAKLKRIVRES